MKHTFLMFGFLLLAVGFWTACGSRTSTPSEASLPPSVTTSAQSSSLDDSSGQDLSRDRLIEMALSLDGLPSEFPGLQRDSDQTGFLDNKAAAQKSLDPNDTVMDMAISGRIDGYNVGYSDFQALIQEGSSDSLLSVDGSYHIFESPSLAQEFLRQLVLDFHNFQGQGSPSGRSVLRFEEIPGPDIGVGSVAGRSLIALKFGNRIIPLRSGFIGWTRGQVVATISITSRSQDAADIELLARRMDEKIQDVLTGRAIVSQALATPSVQLPPQNAAARKEVDLSKFVPKALDLQIEAKIGYQGAVAESDAIDSFQIDFLAAEIPMEFGSSSLMHLNITLEMQQITGDSIGAVLRVLGDDSAEFLLTFSEETGISGEKAVAEQLDGLLIGEVSGGYMVRSLDGQDSMVIYFSRGRISVTVTASGMPGRVMAEDILSIAQIVDERILASSLK